MCLDPASLTLASMGISAATSALGFVGQAQQADAVNRANAENRRRIQQNLEAQYAETGRRMQQEQDAAGAQIQDAARATRASVARAEVAAGEAGVSGLTVDALLGELYGQDATARDRLNQNLDWTLQSLSTGQRGLRGQAEDSLGRIQDAAAPNPFGALLGIGGDMVGHYRAYRGSDYDPFAPAKPVKSIQSISKKV